MVLYAGRQSFQLGLKGPAQTHIKLLKTAANEESGSLLFNNRLNELKSQLIARFVERTRCVVGPIPVIGVNIGGAAREQKTVEVISDRADLVAMKGRQDQKRYGICKVANAAHILVSNDMIGQSRDFLHIADERYRG